MDTDKNSLLNEQVLEIRYKPEARVLDHRGIWTRNLANELNLTEWNISNNRLDVYNKDESRRVFISFFNSGCTLRNQDQTSFEKFTQSFLRFFLAQSPFQNMQVERIGVLGKFANKFDGSFEELMRRYKNNYFAVQPAIQTIFNADLIDIGANLDFKTDKAYIKSQAGAMEKEQLKKFFPFENEPPDVVSYFQIDTFFKADLSPSLSRKETIKLVQEYITNNWMIYSRLLETINK